MTTSLKDPNRTLGDLPAFLRREGAIDLEVEQGVIILRASKAIQDRIEKLLNKQQASKLTRAEKKELRQYEHIDDYLSLLNRLSRNLQSQRTQEAVSAR
jgi:t-SNARE complex subunit (syntaxin)